MTPPSSAPPRLAERLVRRAIRDPRWREITLGDLGEEHHARAVAAGRWRAGAWYWGQALGLAASTAAQAAAVVLRPSGDRAMHALVRDVTLALRAFARQPMLSAVILLTLALGLGSNAATFGMIDSLLLRPFPFPHVDRLVGLSENSEADPFPKSSVAPGTFRDLATLDRRTLGRVAAVDWWDVNLAGGDQPERVQGSLVTADFFPLLSAKPALGRTFTSDDLVWGRHRVVILSDGLWKRRFGADPGIVGRTLRIDGEAYSVIGVMAPGFDFPDGSEVYGPLAFEGDDGANRESHYLTVFAELKPGATLEEAQAEASLFYGRIAQAFPRETYGRSFVVRTFSATMVDYGMPRVLALWQAAALLVMLIGCVNVANLLLARGAERQRELAVRLAIGAGRAHVVRQLLLEAIVIAIVSVPAALGVGWLAFRAIRSAMPATIVRFLPGWGEMGIDARVALFTFAAAVSAAFVFGLIPAFQVSRPELTSTLRDGGRSATSGIGRSRLRRGLVVAQVALALPLLVLAGLAALGSQRFANGPQGYDPNPVVRLRVLLPEATYPDAAARRQFTRDLLAEADQVSGAAAVATTSVAPAATTNYRLDILLEGQPPPDGPPPQVNSRSISAAYFDVMSIPVVEGRAFREGDREGTEPVAVVSQSMARRFWPGASAVGQRLRFGAIDAPLVTVVGVVGDTIDDWFSSRHEPTVYVPVEQRPMRSLFLVARSHADPEALVPELRAALARVDASQPAFDVATQIDALRERTTGIRFIGGLMAAFGVLALVLASFGIYGVMAHYVAQRRAEIGVRMALGATKRDVLRLTLRQGVTLAAIGIVIGLALGIALARLMESALFGVIALEPALFATITLALATVAVLATLVPALQAARVDPVGAIRH